MVTTEGLGRYFNNNNNMIIIEKSGWDLVAIINVLKVLKKGSSYAHSPH
jgi:hypothetical protein